MRLSPNLDDISLSFDLISDTEVLILEDDQFRTLMRLVQYCASGLVWTYTEPSDGSLPDDDIKLARLCALTPRKWAKHRPVVAEFFKIRMGRWHLNRPWISIGGGIRFAIPLNIRAEVAAREGRRCTYCGDQSGPFAFDHIFPVSRGGANDASNLTIACQPCNSSKGARTLAEWFESRAGGSE